MTPNMEALWPTTLADARRHRYAVWDKSRGYPYDQGFCPVALLVGALDFQCSRRIGDQTLPLCRQHAKEYRTAADRPTDTRQLSLAEKGSSPCRT